MFTLFSTPKPFRGEFARIQRNAMRSWVALRPQPEILVFGDEEGTAEACAEFGVRHIRTVARGPSGAPVLSDLFQTADREARHGLLCYVNADIILTQDLIRVVERLDPARRGGLVVSTPVDMPVEEDVDTTRPAWDGPLRARVQQQGKAPSRHGADVFLYPRGYFRNVPPFFIGGPHWDIWLIARGCYDLMGVDATPYCLAIHQRHAGSTHIGESSLKTKEVRLNARHMRWSNRHCGRAALPYELNSDGRLLKRRYIRTWFATRGYLTLRRLSPLTERVRVEAARLWGKVASDLAPGRPDPETPVGRESPPTGRASSGSDDSRLTTHQGR